MKVIINRNFCGHHPASCEQCFGDFLLHGASPDYVQIMPDRACITDVIDDGKPEITTEIHSGGYVGTLVVTDENREEIIYDGWMKFVDMPPEAFDIQPPHGGDIRRMLREQQSVNSK